MRNDNCAVGSRQEMALKLNVGNEGSRVYGLARDILNYYVGELIVLLQRMTRSVRTKVQKS